MSSDRSDKSMLNNHRNTGRANLRKARFFAEHLDDADWDLQDPEDLEMVETYLDAAIVFAKATQDWIKDLKGIAWLKQSEIWNDPVCKYFADTRDVIVHEDGSVQIVARTGAFMGANSLVSRVFFLREDPPFDEVHALRLVNDYIDLLEDVLEEVLLDE